jgi:hypothetical protein
MKNAGLNILAASSRNYRSKTVNQRSEKFGVAEEAVLRRIDDREDVLDVQCRTVTLGRVLGLSLLQFPSQWTELDPCFDLYSVLSHLFCHSRRTVFERIAPNISSFNINRGLQSYG